MSNKECTHTSNWWKEMIPCICCGAIYNDEEADRIANISSATHREFTVNQLTTITQSLEEGEYQ